MISRRSLLGMAPAIPLIGFLDIDRMPDFEANTFAGFTPEAGFSDLVKMDTIGPYLRFVWLDRTSGDLLPHVRATLSAREEPGSILKISVSTSERYETFRVVRHPASELNFPWQDDLTWSQRDAILRLIRVMVRQERGLPVIYKD